MSSHEATDIPRADLRSHPAVKAWVQLGPQHPRPAMITVLKGHPDQPWKRKSGVYRLEGIGKDGSAVIAKRCRQEIGALERFIYEEVLPALPVQALDYYGSVEEPDSKSLWLFLEDAQGAPYISKQAEHRSAAGRWLGLLHTAGERAAQASRLPDHGLRRYLNHLESGQVALLSAIKNPALTPSDVQVLRAALHDLENVQLQWDQLASFCRGLPQTVVHGDFVGKNMCVRANASGLVVVPFDWEMSGWGLPIADLGTSAQPDLGTYGDAVRECWPSVGRHDLEVMSQVGVLLRLIASIDWSVPGLVDQWVVRPMRQLGLYQTRLHDLLLIAPWQA